MTVRETVVVCTRPPEVPVTVMVYVPSAALVPALMVIVLMDLVGFVENDTVTPLGSVDFDSDTLPENPPDDVTVMVLVTLLP